MVDGRLTGFLLVDKPPGPTSHDVVDAARRALGVRRVGHAGTLDPPASGLLVIGVGPATRLLRYVQRQDKTYEVRAILGVRTTTLDADGEVLSRMEVDFDEATLRVALDDFVGEIEQVPPAVSAVKVRGERSYRRAARGEAVELEPRRVRVDAIELTSFASPDFTLVVRCSSGTYVRSLVADIGDRLGCGAHVASLRRTAIGVLRVEDAVSLEALAPEAVRSVESVLPLPVVRVPADAARLAANGRELTATAGEGDVLVVGPEGAIGVFASREGILRPLTVLGSAR